MPPFVAGVFVKIIAKELLKMQQNYKQMNEVDPRDLGIRNKITIHYGIDSLNQKVAVLGVKQKSRIVLKDVPKFEAIIAKLSLYVEYRFSKKILMIHAPVCSKALKALEEKHFNVLINAAV
jgi:hypothetical protein